VAPPGFFFLDFMTKKKLFGGIHVGLYFGFEDEKNFLDFMLIFLFG
jgi:hypothetical protein